MTGRNVFPLATARGQCRAEQSIASVRAKECEDGGSGKYEAARAHGHYSCSSRLREKHFGTAGLSWPSCVAQEQEEDTPAGCSNRPSSTAAASEGLRRTLWGTLRV